MCRLVGYRPCYIGLHFVVSLRVPVWYHSRHIVNSFICKWSVVAERSSALDSSSGVVRMWVLIPAWLVAALVSLSKTLNHNCFVLRMGRKAVGPVCCVMHVKRTQDTYREREGACPGVPGFILLLALALLDVKRNKCDIYILCFDILIASSYLT